MEKYVEAGEMKKFLTEKCGALIKRSTLLTYLDELPGDVVKEATFGKWNYIINSNSIRKMQCSRCECVFDPRDSWKYCPECGARMEANPDNAS